MKLDEGPPQPRQHVLSNTQSSHIYPVDHKQLDIQAQDSFGGVVETSQIVDSHPADSVYSM